MNQTFNLLQQPWLSSIDLNGTPHEFNLRDLLVSSHELKELYSDSPLTTASLYRLLLAVLYAIYQPQGTEDWLEIWRKELFETDRIDGYFDQSHIRERFNLFHPVYPFYQTTEKEKVGKPFSLAAIDPTRASGGNATLFDHSCDEKYLSISQAEAARLIITFQSFALGGGQSGIKGKNFTDAPCCRGVLCFAEGKTLFETLVLNLIPYERQSEDLFREKGIPAWERDNPITDDRSIPDDLLDYLTWQSRRLHLAYKNDQLVIYRSQALALDKDAIRFDPLKPYYLKSDQEGYKPVRLSEGRALWRDSYALFRIPEKEHRPALIFDWLAVLCHEYEYLSQSMKYQFLVFGLATKPGQATMYFSRFERVPLPLKLIVDPERMLTLDKALEKAEDIFQSALKKSVQHVAKILELSDTTESWIDYSGMEQFYWANLELPFHDFMSTLPDKPDISLQKWFIVLRRTALNAFEQVTQYVGTDGRAFKAIERGKSYLYSRLNEILPTEKKEETPE